MTAPTYERPRGSHGTPSLRPSAVNTSSQLHEMNYSDVICIESHDTPPAAAAGSSHRTGSAARVGGADRDARGSWPFLARGSQPRASHPFPG